MMTQSKKKNVFGFKNANRPQRGLALIFDISGFSKFFNKPDLQYYITTYINHIIECVDVNIWGGDNYWDEEDEGVGDLNDLSRKPAMRKFLGDGMLYVWEGEDEDEPFDDPDFKIPLLNRLWNLQLNFSKINRKLYEKIPIGDLPLTVKFGIAQGTVYRLIDNNGAIDYIGPCINLASRLVKYCSGINFICSARVNIESKELEENGYFRIIAKELKSFENEIVIIDKGDYSNIDEIDKKRLFKEI